MKRSTAILLVGYSRPDFIRKRIDELRSTIDFPVIVSIDGTQTDQASLTEWRILQREFPELVWRFQKKNLGISKHIFVAISEVLQEFANCFVIEDDISIGAHNLKSALYMLENRLPEDVMTVGLFGGLPSTRVLRGFCKNGFRKSKYFSAWGWGIQREDWANFHLEIVQSFGPDLQEFIVDSFGTRKAAVWNKRFAQVQEDPYRTWDFQLFFYSLILGKKHLLPIFRSCDNEGFGDSRATNTKDLKPSWYLGKTGVIEIERTIPSENIFCQRILEQVDSLTWVADNLTIQKMRKIKLQRNFVSDKV